jgi:hypothetical protein
MPLEKDKLKIQWILPARPKLFSVGWFILSKE